MNYQVLVNKCHLVDEIDLEERVLIKAVNVENNPVFVEKKTLEQYRLLEKYRNDKGYKIGIEEAYRSYEQQKKLIERLSAKYGEDYAKKYAALPGTSEHQTGLALDLSIFMDGRFLTENDELMDNEDKFHDIHEVLHNYGFILRYPKGKENFTGYPYEPWHIRYVGNSLAEELFRKDITLDEYYKIYK